MCTGQLDPDDVVGVVFDDGRVDIISGVGCSPGFCREYGCVFPDCIIRTGESFQTEEAAKEKYPTIQLDRA